MPIKISHGDILKDPSQALVNPVNCVGVMGKGLALQFKKAFPENFEQYAIACSQRRVTPGRMNVYRFDGRFIINFPTKVHWLDPSRIGHIERGLVTLVSYIKQYQIKSIAIPPLGAGLGGLDWNEVKPLIIEILEPVDVEVTLYEPR